MVQPQVTKHCRHKFESNASCRCHTYHVSLEFEAAISFFASFSSFFSVQVSFLFSSKSRNRIKESLKRDQTISFHSQFLKWLK